MPETPLLLPAHRIQLLLSALATYLHAREPWPCIADCLARAEVGQAGDGVLPVALQPLALEALRDDRVAVPDDPLTPVLESIAQAAPAFRWRQNPSYSDLRLLRRYAYCELVGPAGHAHSVALSAGLLVLAPDTFYPPHAHPAEEAYHLLSGRSRWQQGDLPGRWLEPGARVLHGSGVAHSMQSGARQLLALYVWRGDLQAPARLLSS